MALVQRLSAVLLCLGILAGNTAVCTGWLPTAAARMACCADGGNCPMHREDSHGSRGTGVLTQAEADSCCAATEPENSGQSTPTFAAPDPVKASGPGAVLPLPIAALVRRDGWRTAAPIPLAHVPRHVLLSVFLV